MTRNLGLGGMERQMVGLAAVLSGLGHEVYVLTYRREPDFFGKDLEQKGVRRVILLKGSFEPTFAFERRLAGCFRDIKPDVVIAYGQAASRKASVAHLFFHDFRLIVSERAANPALNIFDLYKSILYKKCADLLITNSFAQHDLFTGAFPYLKKMTVTVPNFVDLQLFRPDRDDKEKSAGNTFTIVTTSRVSPRKNTLGYIKAVRKALDLGADVNVRWYGRRIDSRKYCKKCDALIDRLGLGERFLLLDSIDNPETAYRQADAFCLPSHYEGTSNSLAEAMASGLPIICSDTGDNRIYVRTGVNGYRFDSKNTDDIAKAIVRIAATPEEDRRKMAEESKKTAVEKLGIDAFSARMKEILQTMQSPI